MYPLVSVIMPAYNVEYYIEESIGSVQKQTYQNWELIIINDGSTDKTENIVISAAQIDQRIILLNQQNKGVSCARNQGLTIASGDYIAFLDADDLWTPNFLAELMAVRNNADLIYCGHNLFYCDGSRKPCQFNYYSDWILPQILKGNFSIHICTIIVTKTILLEKNIKFTEDCPIGEDVEFITKILATATVRSIAKNLMLYRIRPGSAMQSTKLYGNLYTG